MKVLKHKVEGVFDKRRAKRIMPRPLKLFVTGFQLVGGPDNAKTISTVLVDDSRIRHNRSLGKKICWRDYDEHVETRRCKRKKGNILAHDCIAYKCPQVADCSRTAKSEHSSTRNKRRARTGVVGWVQSTPESDPREEILGSTGQE